MKHAVLILGNKEKNERKYDLLSCCEEHRRVMRKQVLDNAGGSRMQDQGQAEGNREEQVTHRGCCRRGDSGANGKQNILRQGDFQRLKNGGCGGREGRQWF